MSPPGSFCEFPPLPPSRDAPGSSPSPASGPWRLTTTGARAAGEHVCQGGSKRSIDTRSRRRNARTDRVVVDRRCGNLDRRSGPLSRENAILGASRRVQEGGLAGLPGRREFAVWDQAPAMARVGPWSNSRPSRSVVGESGMHRQEECLGARRKGSQRINPSRSGCRLWPGGECPCGFLPGVTRPVRSGYRTDSTGRRCPAAGWATHPEDGCPADGLFQ